MVENIIVGVIVAGAVIFMLRKFVFRKKGAGRPECGGCDRCGGSKGGCH